MKNSGLSNEKRIIQAINEKSYKDLSSHFKSVISTIYGEIEDEEIIYAEKAKSNMKTDIIVKCKGIEKRLSVKIGCQNTFHCETVNGFCRFLKDLGISNEGLETLKLYHYGDGTTNGTGNYHLDVKEVKIKYAERIKKLNEELNKKEVLKIILEYLIKTGTPKVNDHVDYLYHGSMYIGVLISVEDFIDAILDIDCKDFDSIHFGPFCYCSKYRGLDEYDPSVIARYYTSIWLPYSEDRTKRYYLYTLKKNSNNKLTKEENEEFFEELRTRKTKRESRAI